MMPRRRLLGAPLAAAVLLAALFLPVPALSQAAGDRMSELERRVAALQAEIAALKGEIAALQAKQASEQQAALAELDRKLGVLAEEVEHLKIGEAAAAADRSSFGMGPAASKVYRSGRGVSLGGYGELLYQGFAGRDEAGRPANRTDEIDLLRAVVYLGYKFDDRFLFNSEIEFEHTGASDAHAEGDAGIEFAYVDYLARPAVNVRAGLVLLPMGFLNELHEPPTFLGSRRPDVEQLILPTTWRSPGFGLFGGTGSLSYRTYFVNGLDASRFSGDGGISGSNEVLAAKAKANDFAWVGRLDYVGTPGLLAGGSLYTGRSGQGLRTAAGRRLGVPTTLAEAHAEWKWRGLRLRALGVRGTLGDTADLNAALGLSGGAAVGKEQRGAYLEAGYDLFAAFPHGEQSLVPFLRWEGLDTQVRVAPGFARDPANDQRILTLGLSYKPIDPLVVKLDWQRRQNAARSGVDQLNVALGYIF
ncbi:MAG TPA: hypothetical protein VOA87_02460 [Thermoanaerobaculia bacterium]|nr:hypothetical protein [Thermoanaerobaculia bacterium]